MAKKVTTTTVEETDSPQVNEAEKHDLAVAAALSSQEDGALTIEADKLDEEPETPVTPEKTPEPVIDKEAIKSELKEEVTKEVQAKIVEQLQGTKEEKKDAYEEFEKEIWDKEKRTPTYKEALDLVKKQAKEELKAELQAEIESESAQELKTQQAAEAEQQRTNDNLNKQWDRQLDDLVRSGKIIGIKDPNDNRVEEVQDATGKVIERIPLEPGKRIRYDLFKAMYVASEGEIKEGREPLTNMKEIFYEHLPNRQPAGANAPIAGVRKSVSQDSGKSFKYSDIHNTELDDLLRGV